MECIGRKSGPEDEAFVLRPGVLVPDWSVVADPLAREALSANMEAAGRAGKWSGLTPDEDRLWRAVLREFARTGTAPAPARLARAAGLDPAALPALLRPLRRRDMLVLDESGGVVAAYPFCAWESGHRVRLGEVVVNALCAIDALGAGAMLGRDAEIRSACRECGAPIRLEARRGGRELGEPAPSDTVVWCGVFHAGNCAATSGCALKVFFCSDDHLRSWRARRGPADAGFRLAPEAAFQVGKALFAPLLADGARPPRPQGNRAPPI